MKRGIIFLLICLFQFSYAVDNKKLHVETLAKTTKSWNGSTLPAYPKGQPEITILNITIPAHSKLVWHKHPVINAGYMIRGSLTVKSDSGKILNLKAGDSIVELVNTWHYGKNDSDKPAQIVVFYAGIVGKAITIKK